MVAMSTNAPTNAQPAPTLAELEREMMDPDFWDEATTTVGVNVPNPELHLTIRLEREDVRVLGAGARAANMKLSDYIKQAALETARRANP